MNRPTSETSVSLTDLIRFLRQGLLPAALVAIIASFGAYQLSQMRDPRYLAEATVLVARSTGDYSQFGLSSVTAPPIDAGAYQAAGVSDRVLIEALEALGTAAPDADDIRSLRDRISVVTDVPGRDSTLLRIEARGARPEMASASANAVAEALVAWDRRRASESLSRAIAALEEQIAGLSEQIRALQTLDDASTSTQVDGLIRVRADQQQQLGYARALIASAEGLLSVLQPAGTTPRQVAPRPVLAAGVVAVLAIGVVYGLLLLRSALSVRLRTPEDVAAVTGLPILARFPQAERKDGRIREMTSYLRTSLLSATTDAHPRVFMVTSAHEREGKSLVASALAEALARNGYKTLLVDADLRSPSVAQLYGLTERGRTSGTTQDWLVSAGGDHPAFQSSLDAGTTLDLVPQFRATDDAAELLGRGFSRALRVWEADYEAIVVDTAPVRAVADALTIAPFSTGTVLVVDRKKTDRRSLVGAVDLLQRIGVRILGVVLNRDEETSGVTGYGYGYSEPAPRGRRTSPGQRVKVSQYPLDSD